MADVKFTPGPWEACDPGDYGDFDGESRVVLGNDMRIAVVHWHEGDCRADANARLIAASPDLYDALAGFVAAYDVRNPLRTADCHPAKCACLRCARDSAEAVLAKAVLAETEGRS